MPNNRRLREALLDIHQSGRSGILRVQKKSTKKQLVVNLGTVVLAESNLPEEHLARILVIKGLLPSKVIGEIASLMKAGKTSDEAILAVSNSNWSILEQGRREQAVVISASLLAWDDCDVRFYPGKNLTRCQLELGLALPDLLVLSARRAVSNGLVTVPPDFLHTSFSISQDDSLDRFALPLDPAEYYAYSLVGKNTPAKDILSLIPAGEIHAAELLLRLLVLGLIQPEAAAVSRFGKASSAGEEADPQVPQLEEMLPRLESASAYEILGIGEGADQEEIQNAYHNLARQFHPDRFQSKEFSDEVRAKAQRIFACINESYAALRDSVSRAHYNAKRLQDKNPVQAVARAGAAAYSEKERIAEALFREGRACLTHGDFEKAVEHLRGSVWLRPDKSHYHRYLGIAQTEIPQFRKSAEQHLLKAIELDGTSIASRLALVKLYMKANLPRKAEMQLQNVLRWDPENAEAKRLATELKQFSKAPYGQRSGSLFNH